MKKMPLIAVLFFAAIIVGGLIGAIDAPDDRPDVSTPATVADGPFDDSTIRRDADMTQWMSRPDARGPMQDYQKVDPQLEHSRDRAFLRQLEAYRGGVDRMLGEPAP